MKHLKYIFAGSFLCLALLTACGEKPSTSAPSDASASASSAQQSEPEVLNVDMAGHVSVDFVGAEGHAYPVVNVDWSIVNDLLLGDGSTEVDATRGTKAVGFMLSAGSSVDPTENLSNGDVVTVTLTYSKEIADSVGLVFENEVQTFEVSGLEDTVVVDLFEKLHVSFLGNSGAGTIQLVNLSDDPFLKTVVYTADVAEGLSNAQIVTVTATYDADAAAAQGAEVEVTSREYTVETLAEEQAPVEEPQVETGDTSEDEVIDIQF